MPKIWSLFTDLFFNTKVAISALVKKINVIKVTDVVKRNSKWYMLVVAVKSKLFEIYLVGMRAVKSDRVFLYYELFVNTSLNHTI